MPEYFSEGQRPAIEQDFDIVLRRTEEIVDSQRDLLRDEFATAALMGLLARGDVAAAPSVAARCYQFADAMLEAREADRLRR